MKKNCFLFLTLFAFVSVASAQNKLAGNRCFDFRLGYNIGATSPLGMPAEVRSLNSFTLQKNIQMGLDYEYLFTDYWGITSGVHLDRKAMKTDARTKGYHMKMVQGGESIEGLFTGGVVTKVSAWSISIPVQATYWAASILKLRFGPYLSWNIDKQFNGYAYNGYLRKDTPTGECIEIGSSADERGDYDFKDDMRNYLWGLDFGADVYIRDGWGIYADLQWGMCGVFKSSFKTISQAMYPIYCTIGVVKGF